MYHVNDKDPASFHRSALPVEEAVACPTCRRAKGVACVMFSSSHYRDADTAENTEVPHDARYRAAKMDPYATADAA